MTRNRYVLEDDKLITAAETHLASVVDARIAHKDFADQHGADGHKTFRQMSVFKDTPVMVNLVGLKFDGQPPAGFAVSDMHQGYALPDVTTQRGREIASQMVRLPYEPLPVELAQKIGYGDPLKLSTSAAGKTVASTVGVEAMDRDIIVSVPRENFKPAVGMRQISEDDYKERREQAVEQLARPARALSL